MKKLLLLCAFVGSFLFMSCGNKLENKAEECIRYAYEKCKYYQSPILEDYYVIMEMQPLAKKRAKEIIVKDHSGVKRSDVTEEMFNESMEEMAELMDVSEMIDSIYKIRRDECREKVIGKEVPCEYDKACYSSLKATIEIPPRSGWAFCFSFSAPKGIYNLPVAFLDEDGGQVYSATVPVSEMTCENNVYTAYVSFPYLNGKGCKIASVSLGNPTQAVFTLLKKSLGPVKVGSIYQVPSSVPGLYTEMEAKQETYSDMDGEWTEDYVYFKLDGKVMFRGYMVKSLTKKNDYMEVIQVMKEAGEAVKTEQGVYAGGPLSLLFKASKNIAWSYYFDGFVLAEDKDFVYRISDEYLKPKGETEMSVRSLTIDDFKEGAVIDNISTKR